METSDRLPYLAGFFDGEGCIHAFIRHPDMRRSATISHRVRIEVANLHKPILEEFCSLFGGRVTTRKRYDGGRTMWTWYVQGQQAIPFLEAMLPHLWLKREQAECALELQRRVSAGTHRGGRRRTPECEIEARESLRLKLSAQKADNPYGEDRGDT